METEPVEERPMIDRQTRATLAYLYVALGLSAAIVVILVVLFWS
jgi:hypothetical protein